jgi:hypothetical protein
MPDTIDRNRRVTGTAGTNSPKSRKGVRDDASLHAGIGIHGQNPFFTIISFKE